MSSLVKVMSLSLLFVSLSCLSATAAPVPLAPELQEALDGIRTDPRPKALVKGTHYVISNEPKQWLFREVLNAPGGLYLGVGAEQNYLFIGWSRPEVAVLMDFDELIPRLHDAYASIFRRVDTPEAFLACWAEESHDKVLGWIDEDYEKPRSGGVSRAWKFGRPRVVGNLHKLAKRYTEQGMPTFLTDQAQFTFVRDMVRSGRVRAVRGDVTKKRTMQDIAAFARKACLPVRTLYMSNVEGYINFYNPNYQKNILALPGDERSRILHTDPDGKHTYRYIAEPLAVYRDWIQCKCVYQLAVIRPHYVPHGEDGLFTVERRPIDVPKMAKKARRAGPAPAMRLPSGCAR